MSEQHTFVALVQFNVSATDVGSFEATQVALASAIQVGLSAQVMEVKLYSVADQAIALALGESPPARNGPDARPPSSKPSDRDQVIEEYSHAGMTVQIFRGAGRRHPATYFAVVTNPLIKNPSGGVISASTYAELKERAQARAEQKARKTQNWLAT
ncbi:hypothetical protein [Variovorax sp. N23]|uniref:hypothetical protein n=1 Tax=Variovorax sp. N23 TaxID=2980555 RepID=UPI0021C7D265|nr:hypothetical protein [Variovorax sp. N23]MCU4122213.1 hypothetical protein [Variovorax sp. N23]